MCPTVLRETSGKIKSGFPELQKPLTVLTSSQHNFTVSSPVAKYSSIEYVSRSPSANLRGWRIGINRKDEVWGSNNTAHESFDARPGN